MKIMTKLTLIFILTSGCLNVWPAVGRAIAIQDDLTIALTPETVRGFDPILYASANGVPLIQSTLLSIDNDMGITYDLADEYQISDDKLTWEFKLRDDAYFSNGEQVKASDVAFTFNTAKYNGWLDLSLLKEAVVIDDYTVHFQLEKPLSTFCYTAAQLGIVPENQYDEFYSLNPIGSGPYILKEWTEEKQAIFIRNEHYYGKKPFFKTIKILFMDEEKAYSAAQEGLVDVAQTSQAFANAGVDGMDVLSYKGIDQYGIAFVTVPSGSEIAGKQAGNDVTSEWSIRQAINLAINRDQLINEVLYGYGEAAYNNADQLPWGYKNPESEQTNMDKAKEILKISGWTDSDEDGVLEKQGIKAQFILQFLETDARAKSLATNVKQQLREIGIEVEIIGQTRGEINIKKYKDPIIMRTVNHNPIELYRMYHTDYLGIGFYNTNLYYSDELDRLIEGALDSGDYEAWQFIEKKVAEDIPWTWLVSPDHLFFAKRELNIGEQALTSYEQPEFIFNNIEEWKWEE